MDLISILRSEVKKERQRALHPDLLDAFSLRDRIAVVTGAARGIGEATAVVFAQAGAHVVLADVDKEGLDSVAEQVRALEVEATVVPTDVSQRGEVDALAQGALAAHGRIHVWANVAGIINDGLLADVSEDAVRRVVDVNLLGTYWSCAAATRAMSGSGGGSIINVSSAAGEMPTPNLSGYAMSKAGVISITRTLAVEAGPAGIRVNAIAPGFIDTPMNTRNVLGDDGEVDEQKQQELFEIRRRASPLALIGEPRDIALAMLYLASDASRFVTGQVLRPNGGVAMH
jgi:3-oxoacyl-[acyl-carrier protein] reductase